jgi:flagellar hook assembly protein FlgD
MKFIFNMKIYILFLFLISYILIGEELSIDFPKNYFTPNNDGVNDTMKIYIKNSDNKRKLIDWKLIISDESGKVIKTFQAYHGNRIKRNLINIFKKNEDEIFKFKLPEKVEWVGTDKYGRSVPDGRYIAKIKLFYEDSVIPDSSEKVFYLDNKKPFIKLSSDRRIFTPNNDKINDDIIINHNYDADQSDRWRGMILNSSDQIVKTYFWETIRLPKQILWDGRDDRGILMNEGIYKYVIQAEDFSENKFIDQIDYIYNSKTDIPDVYPDTDEFSPNGDGIKDKIKFNLYSGAEKKIEEWKLTVENIKKPQKNWIYESQSVMPNSITWKGVDANDKILSDGEYNVYLEINQNKPRRQSSQKKKFRINTEEPIKEFKIETKNFTPDGDGENDFLIILPKISNLTFKTWKLSIAEKYTLENETKDSIKILKKWTGQDIIPDKIIWDGISEDGVLASSLSDFVIYFSFRNEFNEHKTYMVNEFTTGINVLQVGKEELKISIPENVFRKKKDEKVINEIKSILEEFPNYTVQVFSHSKIPGDNTKNLEKTERRSKSIFDEIFKKSDVHHVQNSYRGCGEITTIFKEDDVYKQEKNDRIDFLLTKRSSKIKREDCKEKVEN